MMLLSDSNMVFIEPITKEIEDKLDEMKEKFGEIHYINDDGVKIPGTSIFAYGSVDVNNVVDRDFIQSLNIVSSEAWLPYVAVMPTGLDYETGCITTDKEGITKYTNTWDKLKWFKYNHCLIGKPERIIIYEINKFWYRG